MTCERSTTKPDELEYKYYQHKILARAFQVPTTSYKDELRTSRWMLLLPEINYFFVNTFRMDNGYPADALMRFDLRSGAKTEVEAVAGIEKGEQLDNYLGPLWDSKGKSLIVRVITSGPGLQPRFLARLDPVSLSVSDKVSLANNTIISDLLYYNEARDSVVFHGTCGGIVIHGGVEGIYELSMRTGGLKLLLTEKPAIDVPSSVITALFKEGTGGQPEMPALPMESSKYLAVINQRYVIMMRASGGAGMGHYEENPHAYMIDLDSGTWQLLPGITYITWPISQNSLNFMDASGGVSPISGALPNQGTGKAGVP